LEEGRFYNQIDQSISLLDGKIKVKTQELQLIKDLLLRTMKVSEKGDEQAKR